MVRHSSVHPDRGRITRVPILALLLVIATLIACGGESSPTPDAIATHVALEQAVAATLTAGAPTSTPANSPDLIATGVAVQRSIAHTLTAEAPAATNTAVALPTAAADLVATGVAIERAIAATLVATTSTPLEPAPNTPAATPEPSQPPATDEPPAATAPTATPEQPAPTGVPAPTGIPAPTGTPAPTGVPAPTEAPTSPACISWRDAGDHLGTNQCVCGIVTGTYDDPKSSAFFINFDLEHTGYYAISFEHTFAGLESRCVMVCGVIEDFRGRPQTVINSLDQIQEYPTCP